MTAGAKPEWKAGNLPALNQDEYPGLGAWWVNIWKGGGPDAVVVARAYGDTPDHAQERAQKIAAAANSPALDVLFREALAWGMAYGPAIPAHQWDDMRESMVVQYVSRAAQPAPGGDEEGGEHTNAELRQMLDESIEEKKKCYLALGQHQKAIANLIAERDALRRAAVAGLEQDEDDSVCPTCGEDGGTGCGVPNCGLLSQEPDDGA